MSAHTPGPWQRSGVRRKLGDEDCIAVGPDSFAIAFLPIGRRPREQAGALADARLIAAAPDLLETLGVARERIQEDRDMLFEGVVAGDGDTLDDIPDADDRAEVAKYDALLRVIDADIAKATQP